ncbi:PEBP-like protein [Dentipellis sp. KUC8613]|nr:PEBP-like protein [Dentipellis sp. KUC8613]
MWIPNSKCGSRITTWNLQIPADASLTFAPRVLLEVAFPQADGAPPVAVSAGEQLPRNATAHPPTFSLLHPPASTGRGPFVVAMVDLDAPTPQDPSSAQIRHFLGGDFTLSVGRGGVLGLLSNSTPALSEFLQPTPPAGSDAHRYVFLLFAQPAGFAAQTVLTPATPISNFNVSLFAQEVGLGRPLGGSFMLVAPDAGA